MKPRIILSALTLISLGGCAMPPSQSEISQLPIVKFGQPVPGNGNYVLHFPAGQDIATDVGIEGDIFQKPAHKVLKVRLKRDIYSYKDWMSYDKQHWLSARDALGIKFDVKLPGYSYPKPGHIKLELFDKQTKE